MIVTKPTLRLALLLLLALGGCKIVSDKELAAENAKSAGAFDATTYVEKVWTPTAVTDFKTRAVDLTALLPAIEADPEKAGQTYGRGGGEGNPWTYEVKGEGKVSAVDVKSRHGLMTVDIATKRGCGRSTFKSVPLSSAPRCATAFHPFTSAISSIRFSSPRSRAPSTMWPRSI